MNHTVTVSGHDERAANLRRDARRHMASSTPQSSRAHLIEAAMGGHVFVADGSRLFDVPADLFAELRTAQSDASIASLLERLDGSTAARAIARDRSKMQPRLRVLLCAAGGIRRCPEEHDQGDRGSGG
jgi:hypothetical protein